MKRYLKNLTLALLGRSPYQMELEKVRDEYISTAKKVEVQDEHICQLEERLAEGTKKISTFEHLTENLRQRVSEHNGDRDSLCEYYETKLREMKQQYERETIDRHEEYEAKLNALREDVEQTTALLQKANKMVANDLMAQAMLDKTNNGLDDLCTAMFSGDVEKILMATQYLDWSSHLVRIAQCHLNVLRRKNELVERLHFTDNRADDNVNFE